MVDIDASTIWFFLRSISLTLVYSVQFWTIFLLYMVSGINLIFSKMWASHYLSRSEVYWKKISKYFNQNDNKRTGKRCRSQRPLLSQSGSIYTIYSFKCLPSLVDQLGILTTTNTIGIFFNHTTNILTHMIAPRRARHPNIRISGCKISNYIFFIVQSITESQFCMYGLL